MAIMENLAIENPAVHKGISRVLTIARLATEKVVANSVDPGNYPLVGRVPWQIQNRFIHGNGIILDRGVGSDLLKEGDWPGLPDVTLLYLFSIMRKAIIL